MNHSQSVIALPSRRQRLGAAIHPEAVADAWYAADCPPKFNPRKHGVSRRTLIRWRLACWLRGVSPA